MQRYGAEWPDNSPDLRIEFACIRRKGRWTAPDGTVCGAGLYEHYYNAWRLMWPEDDHHRWAELGLRRIAENEINVFLGPGDCVAGETRIWNPITGQSPTIESLCLSGESPTVMTLEGPQRASVPYLKGVDWLYEVRCSNGACFKATARHRVLTRGGFVFVADLQSGRSLLSYGPAPSASNEDGGQLTQRRDACCSIEARVQETVIISIRKLERREFYDLTVPGAGHYFAEGTIHHNSNKTFLVSKFVMCDWWVDPMRTLWLVSSTDRRGAELRIWGKIKEFFNRAKERFPWLQGKVLESRGCITPDTISEDGETARLLTRGLIFIPCKQGNTWLGLGPYAGIKPPPGGKLGHAGDEVSLMHPSFLDAYANWYGKANFRGLLTGNPGDLEDPLCVAAEPEEGWDAWKDSGVTQEWRCKFYGGWAVAFDGRDTPNNDFPYVNNVPRFPYLVGRKKLEAVKAQYGENDWHWWNQCVGKPQTSVQSRRVVTRALLEGAGAFDDVIWASTDGLTKLASLDAAYGGVGGDRCVMGTFDFGKDVEGHTVFSCNKFELVPVSIKSPEPPEVQIALFCKAYCEQRGILPANFFFDGRSTLAKILAEYWSTDVNVVDFGGTATNRPVSNDEYVWEGDMSSKRLKLCNEEYFNFVTELWFSVNYLAVSRQLRNLDKDVAREGYQRTWKMRGNRKQVEPKEEMKLRTTNSPDLFDCLVTGLEGARRLGFEIQSQRAGRSGNGNNLDWLKKEVAKRREFIQQSELRIA